MKKLLLIRHGKADDEGNGGDFVRPLKHSGEKDVKALSKRLKSADLIPQVIYTSPALRAKTTAQIVSDHLRLSPAGQIPEIYEASEHTLLKIINKLPQEYDFVALAGHNPGFSMIASYLTGEYCSLNTSAAVLIDLSVESWDEIAISTGRISWISEP